MIHSIAWQKKHRPTFGKIATEREYLSYEGLSQILKSKLTKEYSGQAAIRLKLLTEFQVKQILGIQSLNGAKIGKYFEEQFIFNRKEMNEIVLEKFRHNLKVKTNRILRKRPIAV